MKGSSNIRILKSEDVRSALPMVEAINTMKSAFILLSQGDLELPTRSLITLKEYDATSLIMPVYAKPYEHISVKIINAFNRNVKKNIPRVHGLVVLFNGKNGKPVGLLDAPTLTAIRTGAASGLATDLMARPKSSIVSIFGAGLQGMTQLEAICAVRPIKECRIYDIDKEAAQTFSQKMGSSLNIPITVSRSPSEAAKATDIICTATVSRTPVFNCSDITSGTHINAIGSFKPDHQEIPEETILCSRLIVDHRESVISETGDLIIPMNKRIFKKSHIQAELGEVAAGKAMARKDTKEITLFKSVGSAIQDLAAATKAFNIAEINNIGTLITL